MLIIKNLTKMMGARFCCFRANPLTKATYKNTTEPIYNFTKAKVIKVYDGDTFWIAANNNDDIFRYKVRLFGIDCPELRDKDPIAFAARDYVEDKLLDKIVDVDILTNRKVNNRLQKEKYGRLLAIVKYKGVNINKRLVELGYAKEVKY